MSLGHVMTDIAGTALSDEDRRRLRHPQVGGVILFSRNYESPQQLTALVTELHALREPRLLIAVDQEGGRVQRFRDGFTRLPPVGELGRVYDRDPQRALSLATTTGWLMAAELRAVGVDLSFAPVLDLNREICPVIGDRAFHRNPEVVAGLAHAYQKGMLAAGMQAVGKHFPGHGGVTLDSHLALPTDTRDLVDIQMEDMLPFVRMIHQGLAGIMVAHVVYSAADTHPAGFSAYWQRVQLRGELGFQGVIFSDDLSMAAADCAGDYPARAAAALRAGCDMILVCNRSDAADQVLDSLTGYAEPAGLARLARLHGRQGQDWSSLHASESWQRAVSAVNSYDEAPLLDMDM
ncbi:MAG: beta-N-acetylhexosaminidase [Gammaproteobacteria bacterium]|nr:beta-N-acetylhexosaminidase [Gammaproteobacteria bacterium]